MENFDANVVAQLVGCTAAESRTCHITGQLSVINKLLLGSMVELRECPDTCRQLRLCNTSGRFPVKGFNAMQAPQYPELLPWLLRTHRCIYSVDVTPSLDNNTDLTILEALRQSSGIKTLNLQLYEARVVKAASSILPCLTNLSKLHCVALVEHGDPVLSVFVTTLSKLLVCSSSLESLHLMNFTMQAPLADSFLKALSHQSQLKELNLLTSSLHCNTYPYALAEYLTTTTMLKVLVVSVKNEFVQDAVLQGVSQNSSIDELVLNDFIGKRESITTVSETISSNKVLRKLTISIRDNTEPEMQAVYDCWILALIANQTLEEVKLPLLILHPSQWAVFFQALTTKQSLKKVHIDAAGDLCRLVPLVCTELKSSGSEEKVSISSSTFKYDVGLLQSKAFSRVNLCFARGLGLAAARVLPSCQHLTCLTVHIEIGEPGVAVGLALLLESTTSLRKLNLFVGTGAEVEASGDCRWWWPVVVALCHNKSLRELCVSLLSASDLMWVTFAESVIQSGSIRWVYYDDFFKDATTFVSRLAKDISENYTLLNVHCHCHVDAAFAEDWLTVQETTRRNWSLVARAGRLNASLYDRYVTLAVERVSLYPALLDELAEQVKTDIAEVTRLVRDRLRQTKTLNAFMRITGVVRESVVCHPSKCGGVQLVDLNEDCWRQIRQYLLLRDVKHSFEHTG